MPKSCGNVFHIPLEESIVSVISVGYSDVDPDRRQKSVEELQNSFNRSVVGQVPAEDNGSVISVCLNRYYKINFIIFKRSWRNDDNKERSS